MASTRAEWIRDIMMGQSTLQGITVKGRDIVSEFENGGSCEKIYARYIAYLDLADEAVAMRVRALADRMLEICILHTAEYGEVLERAGREGIAPEEIARAKQAAPRLPNYLEQD